MRRNIIITAALFCASTMLMVGCGKDSKQVFHLSVNDNSAKTSLGDGYTTWWQDGDDIYVNGTMLTVDVDGAQAWASPSIAIDPVNDCFYAFYAGRGTNAAASISSDAQSYTFTMPGSYTYNPADLHSPMAGIGTYQGTNPYTSIDIPFENLFALLELDVPIASANASYSISITDESLDGTLSGDFAATYGSNGWTTTCVGNGSSSLTVTKNTPETKVYIPIPAGSHKLDIYINAAAHNKMTQSYTFQPGHYYKVNTLRTDESVTPYPFHFGDTIAFFGKGNMSYHANNAPQWALEPNQWDTTTYSVVSSAVSQSSQFVWITQNSVNPLVSNNNLSGNLYHAGYATLLNISDADAERWRVPTRGEWSNVLQLGTTSPTWAYVSITYTNKGDTKTQHGLIIVPPGTPLGTTGISCGNATYSEWNSVPTISSETFETLEKYGCIFLPAFGYVQHSGSGTPTTDGYGYYCTSDRDGNKKRHVLKFNYNMTPAFEGGHQYGEGFAVRLFYFEVETNNTNK